MNKTFSLQPSTAGNRGRQQDNGMTQSQRNTEKGETAQKQEKAGGTRANEQAYREWNQAEERWVKL